MRPYEPSMEEILASIRRIIADDQSIPRRSPDPDEVGSSDSPPASVHVLRGDLQDSTPQDLEPSDPAHEPEPDASAAQDPASHDAASHETAMQHIDFVTPESRPAEPDAAAASHETAPTQAEPEETAMVAQGTIAAPQYPTPEMPTAPAEPVHAQEDGGDYFDPPYEYDRPAPVVPSDGAPLFSPTTNSSVASAFNVLAASRLADNSDELLGMTREMIRPLLRTWLDENLPSMVERLVRDEIERVARGGR